MAVAIFRTRLRPGVEARYFAMVDEMEKIAVTLPGYISNKVYHGDDGERLSVHEWESAEALESWRSHPQHLAAQALGREEFYAEYTLYVSESPRVSEFVYEA